MSRRIAETAAGICMAGILLFTGCGKTPEKNVNENETSSLSGQEENNTQISEEEQLYKDFFDINSKIEIDIDITDEELAKLQADYEKYRNAGSKSPVYRKCDVTFRVTTDKGTSEYFLEDVGVRMKGNTSRTDFYSEERGIFNLINLKLDFQETFDDPDVYAEGEYVLKTDKEKIKDRTFATLEKMDIKWNQTEDNTYIREYYAYKTYREFGILAPETNLTTLTFGGVYEGVFKVYEPVDKIFLKRNLPDEETGGDLYKCGWTNVGAGFMTECTIGKEDEEKGEFYNYDLKTNKKKSDNSSLKELIKYVNSGGVDRKGLEKYIDMDYFIKYLAVAYFVGDPDDMRNNYNNYYVYFKADSGKMIIIPYDNDRAYGMTKQWNPSGNGMTEVPVYSDTISDMTTEQRNPLINLTVTELGLYRDEYDAALEKVAASRWLTTEHFEQFYDIASENYGSDTVPEKEFDNTAGYEFKFDIDRSAESDSNSRSMSFKDYIEAKLNYYNRFK